MFISCSCIQNIGAWVHFSIQLELRNKLMRIFHKPQMRTTVWQDRGAFVHHPALLFLWITNVRHSTSRPFKLLNPHLNHHFSLLAVPDAEPKKAHWDIPQNSFCWSSAHTHTQMPRKHGHGVAASLRAMPPALSGFFCNMQPRWGRTEDWFNYRKWWHLIEKSNRAERKAHSLWQIQDSRETDIPLTQQLLCWTGLFSIPSIQQFMVQ